MKISEQFDIKSEVHTLQLLNDSKLAVIDVENTYRVYDLNRYKLIDGFKSKLSQNVLYVNNMAISPDGKYISFYNQEKKEVLICDTQTRKYLHSITNHLGGVETVEFTRDSKYLITGGMEGRLYMWSVASGKKVDTLSHHSDSISAIASNDQGNWIATAGYDRIIKVFNRSFRKNSYKLISHQEPVTTVNFLSSQRLLSTDKEGTILIWDIVKEKVMSRLPKFNAHITAVCFDQEEQFLFVAGIGGSVGLYDLQEKTLLKLDFMKQLAGISQIHYCNKRDLLIFGLGNGNITIYKLKDEEMHLLERIKEKDFHAAYVMAEENPLLIYSDVYETLEILFNRAYENATKLLRAQKTAEAKAVLKNFTASSAKRLIIQKLFNDFSVFHSFENAIKSKKYMMAYSLAKEYPTLQETPEYKKMEDEWSKVLIIVRKIINEPSSEEKIKQLFRPFMGVPGKTLVIKSLYTDRNVFSRFRKFISEKDYFNAFKLTKGFVFLKELDEYKKLIAFGDILKESMYDRFNNGHYYDAVKLCDKLSFFPDQKEHTEELKNRANAYAEAMKYFAEGKFNMVYNMIEKYPFLEDAQISIDIEKDFLDCYEKAENYAASGNVPAVIKVMEEYAKIKSKLPSAYHLVKIAYWAQIEQAAKAKVPDQMLLDAFEKYQNIFGYESMLEDLLRGINQYRALTVKLNKNDVKCYVGSLDALEPKIIEI